jgi:N-acetylmuramate 1-kinase
MTSLTFTLPEDAMVRLASELALWLKPGSMIALRGGLGAGKTSFARAMIQALSSDPDLHVPSPTFALVQQYDDARIPVVHADLYRLAEATEASELGLQDMLETHALLVEWPDRYPALAAWKNRLDLTLEGSGNARSITLEAHGSWVKALQREIALRKFLEAAGRGECPRRYFQGDASTRRYELIAAPGRTEVLMDMPARSDHMIVKDGKSYSNLVHLADDISAVLAINHYLSSLGYAAPKILTADAQQGFALIEYLRGEVHGDLMRRGDDMAQPFSAAVDVLVDIAGQEWPATVTTPQGVRHDLHTFDVSTLQFETSLLPAWFWPHLFNKPAPTDAVASFEAIWQDLLSHLPEDVTVWVLRDYHSPNLIWMPQRTGLQRTGIIDSQDAALGHPAYDLVSLLQDARVDVAPETQDYFFMAYLQRREARKSFDQKSFTAAYAILGAQRATRLLGTFTRLSKRDGKHQYLQHRPRVARYLVRNLQHPALESLKAWYQEHLPQALELAQQ